MVYAVIASDSEAIHRATKRKHGLLRRLRTAMTAVGIVARQDDDTFFSTDTKNPSVPVRRGVISHPSDDSSAAAAKSSALSHSTPAVCDGGTTENSGCRATKARI